MRSYVRTGLALAGTALVVVVLAACGSSSSSSGGGGGSSTTSTSSIPLKPGENPAGQTLYGKKRGGVLTILSNSDFQHFDPGSSYYGLDYPMIYATQSPLFFFMPNATIPLTPLLASQMPTTANGGITDGGKTVTVHIRHGFHFSPPVNREVTSTDVAYGIERAANPNVTNAYFTGYVGSASFTPLVGADNPKYAGGPIPGIQTPDKYTIVFHLTKPNPGYLIQVLSLPFTSPVPKEMAGPLDKHNPTTYGSTAESFTGPYMPKSDSKGVFAGIGYQAGKSATFVRNPNWSASTGDPRPAYLDQINVQIGGATEVIGPQVLKGSHMVQLDTPSQAVVKLAYESYPPQITFTPGAGDHYGGLDTQHGVFKNVNLRRAVWANMNRVANLKAIGGPLVGTPLTHFIYPGVQGFTEAGGNAGPPGVDYNANLSGDIKVAEKYMKLAGYPSGKYTGNQTVQIVAGSGGNTQQIVAIVNNDLTQLGFHTHVSFVDQAVMYSKYCGVPKQEIDVCPTAGWIRDFADPLSVLLIPFYGPSIVPTNNSNWSQLNDPAINAAMVKAGTTVDPTARIQAWVNVDKMLVDTAAALPLEWDNQPNIESKDVAGVNDLWDVGTWDFAFTSLK